MRTAGWSLIALAILASCQGCGGGSSTDERGAITGMTASITWIAPTRNNDGTALTDLAGYIIYYGESQRNYTVALPIAAAESSCRRDEDADVCSYSISGLRTGIYYFAVTAINSAGNESGYSNEVTAQVNQPGS